MSGLVIDAVRRRPRVARAVIMGCLRLNNLTRSVVGILASAIEPDGAHPKIRLMDPHGWLVDHADPAWSVVDVGCGVGNLAVRLAPRCRRYVGIDIHARSIEKALAKGVPGAQFRQCDAAAFGDYAEFDAVVLSNCLEHIERRDELLAYIFKGPGAPRHLLLRVPTIERDWFTLYKRDIGADWRLDETHFTEYTREELVAELERAGLEILRFERRYDEFFCLCANRNAAGAQAAPGSGAA
ncbi:class I SAM-dependent methyltransferase [Desulfocurvus sp.]|uniref:class I SAM-dependent methyltransferase n=1 Tax=Desulfocurvus sp. TaxID=2871698 RepID=UPI0025BE0B82|nr:class I SAM-dependent methyltransferase [Desulfocurvus sp.]MCK9241078.1 class I SAM-dependent methyltransferase [Desulfocurvus sp.]